MSGGGGDTQSSSQTTTSEPWGPQQPFLEQGMRYALQDVLRTPDQYFPNQAFVPFAPETETALSAQTGRALMGSPLNPAAQGQVMSTLGGGYLGQGPQWDAMQDAVMSSVMPQVDASFMQHHRFGSPLHAEALGRGVARGMAPLLESERERMMQASALAPTLAQQDYFDINQLAGVGARREDLYGRALQDQINRWNFMQQEPEQRLQNYMNLVRGGFGGTSTGSQIAQTDTGMDPVQTGVGAAMSLLPFAFML